MAYLNSTVTLKGASGTSYTFYSYSTDSNWNEGVACVYYISKFDGNNHTHIYIGETQDVKERHTDHHKQECFDAHGANCISIYQEKNAASRLQIEADLRKVIQFPCNG
jgi:predicted GIY-YIG superfamily endonuclease